MKQWTKAELEDIWNNKPVDYLKNLRKASKGKQEYTAIYDYRLITYSEKVNGKMTVLAKSESKARSEAEIEIRAKLRKELDGKPFLLYINRVS